MQLLHMKPLLYSKAKQDSLSLCVNSKIRVRQLLETNTLVLAIRTLAYLYKA